MRKAGRRAFTCSAAAAAAAASALVKLLVLVAAVAATTSAGGGDEPTSISVCSPEKKLVVPESVCGRPLGLQFHHASGDLYVADAYLGLLRAPAHGGLAEVVATEAAGVPFNFLNGLDVDQRTGDVYFTDSSTTYRRRVKNFEVESKHPLTLHHEVIRKYPYKYP
ncbi:hypothetical protein OsJ_29141 [Oryza sativa Japonica Group]|uniref:Uncharacterized protein n=1 Tax=Oryza sativa subsp. japonica TaxID=39947 RepID=B9G395_ORYSJ|nr:hypothetical protein OsJ_29141 [Oryza sativa Japonica Group]